MAAHYGNLGDTKGGSKGTLNTSEKNTHDGLLQSYLTQSDDGYKGLLEALWGKKPENDGEKSNDSIFSSKFMS